MAPQQDPISVRTSRLNNLLIGKSQTNASGGVLSKAALGRRSIFAGTTNPPSFISNAVAENVNRESLLDAFILLYNECDKDALKKKDRQISEFVNKYRSIVDETRLLRVNLEDFVVKQLIGKGYYGKVNLVVERQTGDVYAMKKIKKTIVTTSQVKEERDIMSRRCSEWITNLQYAFQDKENLYLIMEFLPGGDLLGLMTRHGSFDEDMARFYLAELTLAIHALHTMGYVHRDIKPDNILIDRFGHIKLADFGSAAALDRDGHVQSLTPVGTPDYIAPELLQTISTYKLTKSKHDVSCDFWSMGIIGYELVYETTPFHEENINDTYSKILSHCEENRHIKEIITFPDEQKTSIQFQNLIKSLVTNPTSRLHYDSIRKHPFFDAIPWDNLRSHVPPIIPTVKSEDDTLNFDIENATRNKARTSTFLKKSLNLSDIKANEFSGRDLPFIGYSFVHLEKSLMTGTDDHEDARFITKSNSKITELQSKLKERADEIAALKQELLRAEQLTHQSDSRTKILQETKEEVNKMKNIIREKTLELAACHTKIKTLQKSVEVEAKMWEEKEATITDLLRKNRQKFEEAKIVSEQRYEKQIAEKRHELEILAQKLNARETELTAKNKDLEHLHEKMKNYKEMVRQCKEQVQVERTEFEKNKAQLTKFYEEKLTELRNKLRHEKDNKCRLTMELQDVRSELDDSLSSKKLTHEAKKAAEKSNDEILKRLNSEIEANNKLHRENAQLESKLSESQKLVQELQQDISRLERDFQVAECSKNLAESALADQQSSPYETAPGSLTELHAIEEQLRADLETAKENENVQKTRADKLQEIVEKLEDMMQRFNDSTASLSPVKQPHPAPRNHAPNSAGDLLERQNKSLEEKLAAVREEMIVERQAARTAHLSLWKVEKKLEEVESQKKMLQRRMELTEDRIKKIRNERDEAQQLCKVAQDETRQREDRIKELKDEIAILKLDLQKEHKLWEKAEQERMKTKSEVFEHISNINKLREQLTELKKSLQQTQIKNDGLTMENRRLTSELKKERETHAATAEKSNELDLQLKNVQFNFEQLKNAFKLTDEQFSQVEDMLKAEQERNRLQQEQINQFYEKVQHKDETISKIQKDLHEEASQRQNAESRFRANTIENDELKTSINDLQSRLSLQQHQLMEQTSQLFAAQERIEILTTETKSLHAVNENYEREMILLKEEGSRVLSDLFHAKQNLEQTQNALEEAQSQITDFQMELDELKAILTEKEEYYAQRDVKTETTLAQYKKLIDYLQLKVKDLTQKAKKKTFTDMIFGHGTAASNCKKDNFSMEDVQSTIFYRVLREELEREKEVSKSLKEQIEKLKGTTTMTPRSPLKRLQNQQNNKENIDHNDSEAATTKVKTIIEPAKEKAAQSEQCHHFELAKQSLDGRGSICAACNRSILAPSAYFRCKNCKTTAHRKCRGEVFSNCGFGDSIKVSPAKINMDQENKNEQANDGDTNSVGKYSYEGKLDAVDGTSDFTVPSLSSAEHHRNYNGTLVLDIENHNDKLEVNCAYEIVDDACEKQRRLLLGCTSGLYAYQTATQKLLHIAGIDLVNFIAVSPALAKAILIAGNGEFLYQCDFRQLISRTQQTSTVLVKAPALEASLLDLPFANQVSGEKWQLVAISSETENALDSVAIAATSTRIVILKYDLKMMKFKPVRALDTATPVSSILYTRHTAIVASDKFFEIDLNTYAAEEFVDLSDQSLAHTISCTPIVAIRISRHEFLLCFMECGVFVDDFGCRSRPYDLNWEYTPTGFMYREPFLYVAHFQSLQIIRLTRSCSKHLSPSIDKENSEHCEDGTASTSPSFKRVYLPFYMPKLLAESGKVDLYTLALNKINGIQQIHHIDALMAFKQQFNESQETLTSIGTSITAMGSVNTLGGTSDFSV